MWDIGRMFADGGNRNSLGENPVPVPLCSPHIPGIELGFAQ